MNSDVKTRKRPRQHQEADGDSGESLSRRKRPPCSYAHSATSYAPDLVNPVVKLANDVLWREFQTVGTEMMVSSAGRLICKCILVMFIVYTHCILYSLHMFSFMYMYMYMCSWSIQEVISTCCSLSEELGLHQHVFSPLSFHTSRQSAVQLQEGKQMGLSEAVQQKIHTKGVPASWWH